MGMELSGDELTAHGITEAQRQAAMRTCARNSLSAPELRGYLEALGLINHGPRVLPLTPSARAAASPHGAEVRRARRQRNKETT